MDVDHDERSAPFRGESGRDQRGGAADDDPWEGVPPAFRLARIREHLACSENVAVAAVARAALQLVAEGAFEDAMEVVKAVDAAIERTGQTPGRAKELTYAREVGKLPESFPRKLRRAIADAAASSRFEGGARALRWYRVVHFIEGPAVVATLRRWAPVLTERLIPRRIVGGTTRTAGIVAGGIAAFGLVFKIAHLLHAGHAVTTTEREPAWVVPTGAAPLDGMVATALYLEREAESLDYPNVREAAAEVSSTLQESPVHCDRLERSVAGVKQSLSRLKTHELQTMIAPEIYLLDTLPRVCLKDGPPAPSLSSKPDE